MHVPFLDPKAERKKDTTNDTINFDSTQKGDGDPGYWFNSMLKQERLPVYAIPETGPIKYMQVLYAICLTVLPTPDFLPFVKSHIRGFLTATDKKIFFSAELFAGNKC